MAEQLGEAVLVLRTDDSGLDKGIERAEGKARGLGSTFDTTTASAGKLSKGLGSAGSAATASAAQFQSSGGQISQFAKILARDMDFAGAHLSSASSPFVMPVKQAPAVASAMRLVSLGTSALAGVLGGVLVTGSVAAGAALLELILKTKGESAEINNLVEKLKEHAEKTRLSRLADEAWSNTLDGLIERQRKLNEELGKRLTTQGQTDKADLARASADAASLSDQLAKERANLARLKSQRPGIAAQLQNPDIDPGSASDLQARLSRLDQQITTSRTQINKLETAVANAQIGITRGQILAGEAQGAAMADLSARARKWAEDQLAVIRTIEQNNPTLTPFAKDLSAAFEVLKKAVSDAGAAGVNFSATTLKSDALNKQLHLGSITVNKYAAEIRKLAAALEAQAEAAKEAERANRSNQQSGRQVNEAEARAIVAGIGGVVTSGSRTAEHNKDVGGVPNSFHVKGQALDIAKTAGMTLGKIVKAFEAAGVHLIEKLDEGDHFHVAFGKRGGSGPSAETIAKRAVATADAEERREQAFQNEKASLQGEELNLRKALITSPQKLAELEKLEIEGARLKYQDNLKSLVTQRKLTAVEGDELSKINDERARLRTEIVQRREQERAFREAEAANERQLDERTADLKAQAGVLQSQEGLARTQAERREIELRLLDLQFQEERLRLQAIIAYAERLRLLKVSVDEQAKADSAATIAQGQLGTLPAREANARAGAMNQTAGPLEAMLNRLPQTAAEISEAFEAIAANGIDALADSITGVIMGTQSLGEAFNQIARQIIQDILAMTIKMLIFKAISAAFGMGGGGGGSSIAPSAGQILSGSFVGPRARGGPVHSGGLYLVGEEGPELFAPGHGGTIISNDNMRRSSGAGGAPNVSVTNHNDFRGADSASVSAIEGRLDQMERELPGRVVSTMQDAKQRFVWRG